MPRVNIWLPDDLYDAVKEAGIPMSRVCQKALRIELEGEPQGEVDTLASLARYLRDLGDRQARMLRRVAKKIEDNWED